MIRGTHLSSAILAFSLMASAYGCTGAMAQNGSTGAGSGTGSTEGSADAGQSCSSSAECGAAYLCVQDDAQHGCGVPGTCTPLYTDTGFCGVPVCGCDGKIYPTACAAELAGISVTVASHCPVPSGSQACGDAYCDNATEYCLTVLAPGDASCGTEQMSCEPIPQCDAGSTCQCIMSTPPGYADPANPCMGDLHTGYSIWNPNGC